MKDELSIDLGVNSSVKAGERITLDLAQRACSYDIGNLSNDIVERVTQCFVDWVSVAVAGVGTSIHTQLLLGLQHSAGTGASSVIGNATRYCPSFAAMVNGATSHALDFDDVNLAISGHPSAVIASAGLALAESRGKGGADLIAAYVAGYETACDVGTLICPEHMDRGFHATGTIGSLGAAAACAHLMGFDPQKTAATIGLAATQAAGLKAMFGTMVKPLHAGFAARVGVESALLVEQGFDSRVDILECNFGFARTHSSGFHESLVRGRNVGHFHLCNNLFKYDASCYGTHAAIACVRLLTEQHSLNTLIIKNVHIRVDTSVDGICNIKDPKTGLEGKFSVRLNVAFALLGINTGDIASYTDELVNDANVKSLMSRISVELVDGWPSMQAEVAIDTTDGKRFSTVFDASVSSEDLVTQKKRVNAKFEVLVGATLGEEAASRLLKEIHGLRDLLNVNTLLSSLCWCWPVASRRVTLPPDGEVLSSS